jgi:glycosyltransferase involved in cell wall biosynthesis
MRVSRLTQWFKTRAYREASVVLFNGEEARRLALASWRGAAPRALVVPHGVRIDALRQNAERRQKRVCFVGRLSVEKDPVAAVRAFSQVAPHFPQATLDIYGDGPLRQLVNEEVSRSNARDRIVLHGYTENVAAVLSDADILLLPSRAENIPYAVLEAMAGGCAVIATSVGDVPTLLAGGAGIVVDPGDGPALAAMLRRYLADPQAVQRAGHHGRERIAALYTLDRMISNTVQLYESAVTHRSGSGRLPLE